MRKATEFAKIIYNRSFSWGGYFTCRIDGELPAIGDEIELNKECFRVVKVWQGEEIGDVHFRAESKSGTVAIFETNTKNERISFWDEFMKAYPYFYGRVMDIKQKFIGTPRMERNGKMKTVFLTKDSSIQIGEGQIAFINKGKVMHQCGLSTAREVSELTQTEREEAEQKLSGRKLKLSECYYVVDRSYFITDALSAFWIADELEQTKKGTEE